jgi:hypothetical protein
VLEPTTDPGTLPERIAQTFVAPRALGHRFRGHAPWMGALLLATLVAVLAVAALPADVFVEQMQDPVTRRGRPVEITSPPEEIARYGRYLGMLAVFATYPLVAFAIAGILTLLFSVLGRGAARYTQHLALTAHGLLIPSLGTLLALPIQHLTADTAFQFSLSRLLPLARDPGSLLYGVLDGLNLFTLWMVVVLGVGISALEPRFGAARASAILLALYVALQVTVVLATSP